MGDPDFYREAGEKVGAARNRLAEVVLALEEAYARWEKLERVEG